VQKFYLSRVRLNSGGYDSCGAYWGLGRPLFSYCSVDGKIDGVFRALNRHKAKLTLAGMFPGARFYR